MAISLAGRSRPSPRTPTAPPDWRPGARVLSALPAAARSITFATAASRMISSGLSARRTYSRVVLADQGEYSCTHAVHPGTFSGLRSWVFIQARMRAARSLMACSWLATALTVPTNSNTAEAGLSSSDHQSRSTRSASFATGPSSRSCGSSCTGAPSSNAAIGPPDAASHDPQKSGGQDLTASFFPLHQVSL